MILRYFLVLCMAMPLCQTEACTSLIVGKQASKDGSVIVSYSSDDYGGYGYLCHYPSKDNPDGSVRYIYDWETNNYLGEIEEVAHTYNVVGNINENQVTIVETTFGGREELVNHEGLIDYGSLMYIALQRSKNAREAIKIMTDLVGKYGYNGSGESFTVADPNEAWILEMIGKGEGNIGAVWVAVRIPDDCISAHANHSRIRTFPLNKPEECLYSHDVISFAREKGYFHGKDEEFSFSEAYAPSDFAALRFCEARVWSFFSKYYEGMEMYLPYASGEDIHSKPMPLFVRPNKKLSVQDIKDMMRDHFENTPFAFDEDLGGGPYNAPYRPAPLVYSVDGKEYFNERPISTQQSAFVLVAQMRDWLPDYIGGLLWFSCDDANMTAFTPVYCSSEIIPYCYSNKVADALNFSFESAFWVCNWVSNMVYAKYDIMFEDLKKVRNRLEHDYNNLQTRTEKEAQTLGRTDAIRFLSDYSNRIAQGMLNEWMDLGKYLMVKYIDGGIRPEENGEFKKTAGGYGLPLERPGYPVKYRRAIVNETKGKYIVK